MDIAKAVQRGELGHMATVTGADSIAAHLPYLASAGLVVPAEAAAAAAQLVVFGSGDTPRAARLLTASGEIAGDFVASPPAGDGATETAGA